MKRRRKWRAPNNPTAPAKQVWKQVYGEPWPKGWRVEWAGFMRGAHGMCLYNSRRILLNYADARSVKSYEPTETMIERETVKFCARLEAGTVNGDGEIERWALWLKRANGKRRVEASSGCIDTLLHEFTHLRQPRLKHGIEFNDRYAWAKRRLYGEELRS